MGPSASQERLGGVAVIYGIMTCKNCTKMQRNIHDKQLMIFQILQLYKLTCYQRENDDIKF